MRVLNYFFCFNIIFLLLFCANPHLYAKLDTSQSMQDKFQEKLSDKSQTKNKSLNDIQNEKADHKKEAKERAVYNIQKIHKGRVESVIFNDKNESGFSTKTAPAYSINVYFKINAKGDEKILKYFNVFLYDDQKNKVAKLGDSYVVLDSKWHSTLHKNGSKTFTCRKTFVVQFPYNPQETKFKYYLCVMGDDEETSAMVKPFAELKDFEFDGKDLLVE